jgi:hypothetical protein
VEFSGIRAQMGLNQASTERPWNLVPGQHVLFPLCCFLGENTMRLKMALAGILVAGFVLPAAAQTTVETYYVVQDMKTKTCTVTEKKPAATETTVSVVNGVVYKTKTEAEGAIKTITTCTTK